MKEIDNETQMIDAYEKFVNEQCENSKTGFAEPIRVDYLELEEKLNKLNVKKIDTIDDLKKIIDFTIKDGQPEPIVVADGLSLIIIDNKNYNETYLIDVFEKFVNEQSNKTIFGLKNTKFYYIDSIELKSFIHRMGEIVPIQDEEYLEKHVLVPRIMILDKKHNDIGVLKESIISVLDESDFKDVYRYITRKR